MKRLLSFVLALTLCALTATSALATEQTVTVTTKVTVPFYGKTALGTMVFHNSGTRNDIDIIWSFTGQYGGAEASASGKAHAIYEGSSYSGTITAIDSWHMPGIPKPGTGMSFTIEDLGNHVAKASVNGFLGRNLSVNVNYQGVDSLPDPTQSDVALSVTNVAGSGVNGLPNTGAVPEVSYLLPLGLLGLLGAGLFGVRSRSHGAASAG